MSILKVLMRKMKTALRLLRLFVRKMANKLRSITHEVCCTIIRILKKSPRTYLTFKLLYWTLRNPVRAIKLLKDGSYKNSIMTICRLKFGDVGIKHCNAPVVSIIIPVYNQVEFTYQCIKSIEKNTADVSYEIIVADDVSHDDTKSIGKNIKGVRIIRNKQNLGFLKNCNNAAKRARGKYILFLNNDTEVTSGWLSSLLEVLENNPTVGLVGSKFIFPDGKLQEAGGIITKEGVAHNYGKFDDPTKPEYNYVRDAEYISGASILISKKLWDDIGGFDERYSPAYCEDSDLAFAVRSKGYRVVLQPKSVVVHYEGATNGKDETNGQSVKHYQIENSLKLQEKWKKEFKTLPSNSLDRLDIRFRDRISRKKVVLVIDHYVPEYDKDAGSRTTYQYLQLLVQHGYLVKFLPDDFCRREDYTDSLENMGIEVLYGLWYRDNWKKWIKNNANNIDIVYMNRPHITVKYIDFIRKNTRSKIIYYGHDLHFLREQREYELTKDDVHLLESKKFKKIEFGIMRKADYVYYPSIIERDLIKSLDQSVNVKAINAYMFSKSKIKKYDFNKKHGLLFVGGFNHRPNVDAMLWFASEIYPKIISNCPIPLYVVGSNLPNEINDLRKIPGINILGYVSDSELAKLYNQTKIVVAPLRYGAGIKGKVVEAMSVGAVTVTTTVGAEGIGAKHDVLTIADDADCFADTIIKLYSDNDVLSKLSDLEQKYIRNHYSMENAWNIIKDDFNYSVHSGKDEG